MAAGSSESPKFFKTDITSILKEKNELKNRVIELEEEVEILRREVIRLSSLGNGQSNQESTHTVTGSHSNAAGSFWKPFKYHHEDVEHHITHIVVTGYKKIKRHYVYVIELTWSDGQRYEIYRRYGEFFTFQQALQQQLFPQHNEGKKFPTLPTIGWSNSESVIRSKLAVISEYCQALLFQIDTEVSRSPQVLTFFRPAIGDTQLPKLNRVRRLSDVDLSTFSVYPQNIPAGSTFEEYVVLADYEPVATGEISAKAGDRVNVIQREDTGWWLVTRKVDEGSSGEMEEIGYISADYLKPYKGWAESSDIQEYLGFVGREAAETREQVSDTTVKYMALEDYSTRDPRQLCLRKEDIVVIIEMSEDGWWLVSNNGKQGWVPASYLQPSCRDQGNNKVNGCDEESKGIGGNYYVAMAGYYDEHPEDITFPKGARVEVVEKTSGGWWLVRSKGQVGMAPASYLTPLSGSKEDVDGGVKPNYLDSISGIMTPPPRSKIFMADAQKRLFELSSTLSPRHSNCP